MARVFDCFSFFNELDLLEIRLNELNEVADIFVLVEATRTFQKKSKPLFYQENKERFKKFSHKIRHVVVDQYPNFLSSFRVPTPWDYDDHQKDQVKQALFDCAPDDTIVFSDLDEIPSPQALALHKHESGVHVFQQRIYHNFINCLEVEPNSADQPHWWYGSVMTSYKNFKSVRQLRVQREINKYKTSKIIPDAGWHFTSLGGVEGIMKKIESWAHSEFNRKEFLDPELIQSLIEKGKSIFNDKTNCVFVKIDSTYPKFIQQNQQKLAGYMFHSTNG